MKLQSSLSWHQAALMNRQPTCPISKPSSEALSGLIERSVWTIEQMVQVMKKLPTAVPVQPVSEEALQSLKVLSCTLHAQSPSLSEASVLLNYPVSFFKP